MQAQESIEQFKKESWRVLRKILKELGTGTGPVMQFKKAFQQLDFRRCEILVSKQNQASQERLENFFEKSKTVVKKLSQDIPFEIQVLDKFFALFENTNIDNLKTLKDLLANYIEIRMGEQTIQNNSFKNKSLDEILKYIKDIVAAIQDKKIRKSIIKDFQDPNMKNIIKNILELDPK